MILEIIQVFAILAYIHCGLCVKGVHAEVASLRTRLRLAMRIPIDIGR
jgi:hypothetical protein